MIWKLKIFFTCQTWPFTITRFLWSLAPWIMCCIPGTWHDYLTVTGTIIQCLTRFFNSCWHHCSTVTGTIVQQTLARLFNSHWQGYSTVADRIIHQSLAPLFNSHWHHCSTATGKIFSFFYAGRILQQWCSLLTNRAMYQEHDVWSKVLGFIGTVFIVKSHVWQVKKICSFQSLNPWMTKNTPILNFNFF